MAHHDDPGGAGMEQEEPKENTMTTPISAIEIAKLTAMITGGGYKRAANREAAAKRFTSVAAERGIPADAAEAILQADDPAAALTLALEGPETNTDDRVSALAAAVATIRSASADELAAAVLNEEPAIAAAAEMLRSGHVPAHGAPRERKSRDGGPTKREIATGLLTREGGCTTRDILDATGWPSVSVPSIAEASGLTLRTEKEGRTTRYFGEPR
jgi:hypothetical protein